ncbi:MAG: HDOD domain-containing protein [Planctomycetota bacterium]
MGFWQWFLNNLGGAGPAPVERPVHGDAAQPAPAVATATVVAAAPKPYAAVPETAIDSPAAPVWWRPVDGGLLDLSSPPEPELSTELRALEGKLISHFDGHDLSVPPMPQTADRVLRKLRDTKTSAKDIAKDLADDQVSAAYVLRLANSALYRGASKITNLQAAVARLGVQAIRTLMMHQSMRAALFHGRSADRQLVDWVWTGSLASAAIMHQFALLFRRDPDEAFLLGLIHDIGNVIVLREVHNHGHASYAGVDLTTFEYLCAETHQEFGELIATAWDLPPNMRSLVADHHRLPEPDDPLKMDRAMLMLTEMIKQMLGFTGPMQYDLLRSSPAEILGLSQRPDMDRFLEKLPERIDETLEPLS